MISSLYATDELNPENDEGVQGRIIDRIISIMHEKGGHAIILSAELPYDTARFEDADAVLACYNARGMKSLPDESLKNIPQYGPNVPASLYIIFGGCDPSGRLPVNIPGLDDKFDYTDKIKYKRGFGLEYVKENADGR
jgi:beta-N-acetylhexosaminidase